MILLLLVLGTASCTAAPATTGWSPSHTPPVGPAATASTVPAPSVTMPAAERRAASQGALDAVATAIRRHDRAAYRAQISAADPGFAEIAERLYANLSTLPLTALRFRVLGGEASLTPAQQAAVPGGWRLPVLVDWRLRTDTGTAAHQLWVTFAPGGRRARLAGTSGPYSDQFASASGPAPLWALEEVRSAGAAGATVVVGAGLDPAPWLSQARAAASAVRQRLRGGLRTRWAGGLVVEVPATEGDFERVIGAAPGSYRRIAAVTWPEGPDPRTAAVRILVDPAVASRLSSPSIAVLLTHETTHVATRSVVAMGPMWLVEGFADYIAYDRVPAARPPAEALVRTVIARNGAPSGFPADRAFTPSAADLDVSYAEAWLACRFIARTHSPAALNRLYAAVTGGHSLATAVPAELGISADTLVARWRADLLRTYGRS